MNQLIKLALTSAILMVTFAVQAFNFQVSGTVINAQSQQPVPGIVVKLHLMGTQYFETVNTTDDGTYAFNVEVSDSIPLHYVLKVYPGCTNHPIIRTGPVVPEGVVEDFEICGTPNPECHAGFFFHHNPQSADPLEIEFTDHSFSQDSITGYAWDFGDGATSVEENPVHVFPAFGSYEVTLTITTASCSDSETKTVVIQDQSMNCHADFFFHHAGGPNGNPAEFDFTNHSQAYSPIVTFAWDFGDGTSSDEENPTHIFSEAGNYNVTLVITTESGCTDDKSKMVHVHQGGGGQTGCEADFDANQSNHHPMKVYFHDKSQFQPGTWYWEFGDGETSTQRHPVHTYAAGGEYTVTLTINGADSTCTDTYSEVVVVEQFNWGCEADFDFHQSWHHPMEVHFFDKSQYQPGTRLWAFGDGETATERNPHHTYAAAGTYTVVLTITSADSTCVDTYSEVVIIEEIPDECHANFWWHHNCQSQNPLEIQFVEHSYSYSPVATWAWDFGDGNTSDEENPAHLYSAFGLYPVTLDITTESGCSSSVTYNVWVHDWNSNCLALFVPVIDSTNTLLVHFQDLSLGDIETWAWDFGDGITSDEQNPSHEYAEAGLYTVSLTVSSENCTSSFYYDIDLVNGQVMVNPGPATGLTEQPAADFVIFPNPVQDILYIGITAGKEFEAQIITLTGQVVATSRENTINVSGLPNGMYILQLKYNHQILTKKFAK